jgi:hypothetical protein
MAHGTVNGSWGNMYKLVSNLRRVLDSVPVGEFELILLAILMTG